MEVSGSNGLNYDIEEKALKGLLDSFGSVFTLQEIAFAYCNAGRNVDLAGEILCDKQGSTPISTTHLPTGEARIKEASESSYGNITKNPCHANGKSGPSKTIWRPVSGDLAGEILCDKQGSTSTSTNRFPTVETRVKESSESSYGNIYPNPCHANGKSGPSKTKWRSVSGGTISSLIGKEYVKPTQPANGSGLATKPLKLDSKEFPVSALWGEGSKSNPSKDDHLQKDMEDLLFKLLGEGFQLSRDVIREVLDSCGYDMPKSMLKLLDRSAEALDERMKTLGKSEKCVDMSHTSGGLPSERKLQQSNSSGSYGKGDSNTNKGELLGQPKDRNQLQKEVLAALFNAPEKSEELPNRTVKTVRSKAFGQVVTEPPRDFEPEYKTDWMRFLQENKNVVDGDKEDSFQVLRRAVMEYRGAMKEYCKAAVDAFSKGDHERAAKLLEQGQFFYEKAREADEESNTKIFETSGRNRDTQDDMLLDLHEDGPREAIRLLKCHLSSLSGIPTIKYLKVILETDDQDITKGARRRLVMKLLERESIQWTEDGNPGTILIALDKINPKRLSFAKK